MAALREITAGLRFHEGPVAMPDGSVLLVEIAAGRLTRVAADGTKSTVYDIGAGPNGAAIGPDGQGWICNNGGFKWHEEPGIIRPVLQADDYSGGRIERVDLATGAVQRMYDTARGFVLRGPLHHLGLLPDRIHDAAGIGFVWSHPDSDIKTVEHPDEYTLELGYVLQLTPTAKLQPDLQVVWNRAYNPDPDAALVFQIQLDLAW